ncbi:MAG TPA: Hsp33 family molecular chaperone HslO [Candidatus Krumholzibacteria bacterium]|nr:Hsp33 family molecular chaperone HslO [Candidatus Krumholzibacteria bacterium]
MSQTGTTATVERHILRERDAMLGFGDFGALFEAYHAHARRLDLPLDPLGTVMMHQALAGAALQLSFRVVEESTAWTLNVHRPAANVFAAGGGPDSTLTGRYFVDDVETIGENRLYVQRSHPEREPTRSVLSVDGIDLFEIFQQYFHRSEQLAVRFVELSSSEMAAVFALPGADAAWIRGLDGVDVRALRESSREPIESRTFTFACTCDGERVARVLAGMFGEDPEALFQGDASVEARCPRCGALWSVDREAFDRALDRLR